MQSHLIITRFKFRYLGPTNLLGDQDSGKVTTLYWRICSMCTVRDTYAHACSYYSNVTDQRLVWELMKMEIIWATIAFSKSKAKCISNGEQELRRRIDQLDAIICDNFSYPYIDGVLREYDELKSELKSICEEKGKRAMFRGVSKTKT